MKIEDDYIGVQLINSKAAKPYKGMFKDSILKETIDKHAILALIKEIEDRLSEIKELLG